MNYGLSNHVVYLVGGGPGDPDLITVRGKECLKRAQVVIYDYLVSKQLLDYIQPDTEVIYVGKKASSHTLSQNQINKLLVEKALENSVVVRLKGGDPFVFGRGGEECQALFDAGIDFEIVPGVTSGIAALSYAGIPATHRHLSSSVAFITGHEDLSKEESAINWKYLSQSVDTLVFYMGVSSLPSITMRLQQNGLPADIPAAVIQWGTTPDQRTVISTLGRIAQRVKDEKITAPAITVIGNVVNLRENLLWFEKRPLFGKKIIITRTRRQVSRLRAALTELGASVIEIPTIKIEPVINSKIDSVMENTFTYDWILFTSVNAVEIFFENLLRIKKDIRFLGSAKIGCIGPATAEAVNSYKIKVDIIAKKAVAEGLLDSLQECGPWQKRRVLIPRATEAREILPQKLGSWGAIVDVLPVYKTVCPKIETSILEKVKENNYDLITFTSSSTFRNFVSFFSDEELQKLKSAFKAASIGPVTSVTMRNCGVEPLIESQEHTIPGLVNTIKEYLSRQ